MATISPYAPLPHENSIRLLHLRRGHDTESIFCWLTVHELDKAPKYEALSYVWGNQADLRTISLNDANFSIGSNLYAALRQIRSLHPEDQYRDPQVLAKWSKLETEYTYLSRNDCLSRVQGNDERILWVDAICINQQENEERTHQVKLMAAIYSGASQVLIWLGPEKGDVINALPIITAAVKEYYTSATEDNRLPYRPFSYDLRPGYPGWEDRSWKSLMEFYDREWFERLWVIQEVALAKTASVFLGELILEWDIVGDAVTWLLECDWDSIAYTFQHIDETTYGGLERCLLRMHIARDIQHIKKYGDQWNIIRASSTFKCALPIDRIYGILGLIPDAEIEPDYSKQIPEAFRSIARYFIEKLGDLLILGQVHHPPVLPPDIVSSWVPNWPLDVYHQILNLPSQDKLSMYQASADQPFFLVEQSDENFLLLQGIPVCRVISCGPIMNTNAAPEVDPMPGIFEFAKQFMRPLLSSDTVISSGCYAGEKGSFVFDQVLVAGQARLGRNASPDLSISDSIHTLSEMMKNYDDTSENSAEQRLSYPLLREAALGTCRDRRLFRTDDGHFGVGPRAMEPGDEIVILFGGLTPFVVRNAIHQDQDTKGNLRRSFIGECYIHGLMKGEAVFGMREGLHKQEIFELI